MIFMSHFLLLSHKLPQIYHDTHLFSYSFQGPRVQHGLDRSFAQGLTRMLLRCQMGLGSHLRLGASFKLT